MAIGLLVVLALQWPILTVGPDFVDDPGVLLTCQGISDSYKIGGWKGGTVTLLYPGIDKNMSRFRPAWWPIVYGMYEAFDLDFVPRRVIKLFLFLGAAVIIHVLARKLTKALFAPLFANLLFWLCWPGSATLYKFPTQEEFTVPLALLALLALWSATRPRRSRAFRALLLFSAATAYTVCILLKETMLAFAVPLTVWAVWQWWVVKPPHRHDLLWFPASVAGASAILVGWFITHPIVAGSYGSGYAIPAFSSLLLTVLQLLWRPWEAWGYLYPIGIAFAAVYGIKAVMQRRFDDEFAWKAILLVYFVVAAAMLAPWQFAADYRLLWPGISAAALLVGWQLAQVFDTLIARPLSDTQRSYAALTAYGVLGVVAVLFAARWTWFNSALSTLGPLLFVAIAVVVGGGIFYCSYQEIRHSDSRVDRAARWAACTVFPALFLASALATPLFIYDIGTRDCANYWRNKARQNSLANIAALVPANMPLLIAGRDDTSDASAISGAIAIHPRLFMSGRRDIAISAVTGEEPLAPNTPTAILWLGSSPLPPSLSKQVQSGKYINALEERHTFYGLGSIGQLPGAFWLYPDRIVAAAFEPLVRPREESFFLYPSQTRWTLYLPR